MTGDGTNDAPALAQADVAVAMNTGTQAAKEAGNMVDLDSNPTKLIEVVEIGKQLLITRGSLTTFSIANDVAKYFAIIPAAFATTYPQLNALNVMHLASPQSAILSAVIFNALIIIALIPLALRGVRYRAVGAAALLRRNLLIYGARRDHRAVRRHQAHRPDAGRAASGLRSTAMTKILLQSLLVLLVLTVLTGIVYPLLVTGIAQLCCRAQAEGSLIARARTAGRLGADRPAVRSSDVLLAAPVGDHAATLQRRVLQRLEPRADQPGAARCRRRRASQRCSRRIPTNQRRCRSIW